MSTIDAADFSPELRQAFVDMVLCGADDDFLIGHADSEWTGLAPILEEDIAVSSIAQDEVAHARELYALAAEFVGRSADDVAYGRTPDEYRCAALCVTPDDFDWSMLIARQFYYDHFDALRLERWKRCAYRPLADLSQRIAAEERFHVHHVDDWIRRLGGSKGDARERIEKALSALWPHAVALFEEPAGEPLVAAKLCPRPPKSMFDTYRKVVGDALSCAGLAVPSGGPDPARLGAGGRRGRHGPQLSTVLEELAEVYRLEPGATW
ncbi:MAG: phenylacetate-CoA oxygenase subunit PaaC [Phycisphaerae bacterium]|nr:phenylacetate-CoA oxygenase subunit PaaC [Phycisphaerae bacterium]NUQ45095.1 phenylacetate-CoA oxygenase subunit PaaC [Phycisphaerae bacterium]